MDALTLADLRAANVKRLPVFKNSNGAPAHSEPDGSDWSLPEWMNAVAGEVGEAANLIKKIRRGDYTLEQAKMDLADELADILIYLDLVAYRAGIDMDRAVVSKFNLVSARVGCDVSLALRSF